MIIHKPGLKKTGPIGESSTKSDKQIQCTLKVKKFKVAPKGCLYKMCCTATTISPRSWYNLGQVNSFINSCSISTILSVEICFPLLHGKILNKLNFKTLPPNLQHYS